MSEAQAPTYPAGSIAERMQRAVANEPPFLSDAEMEKLRTDIESATAAFLSDYPPPHLRGMPPAPPIRDVLDVWIDAIKEGDRYEKHPGDFFVVHKVIPELLNPQGPYVPPRPWRPSLAVVNNRTGEVTWDPPLPAEEAERRVLMARRQRDACAHLEFHAERVRRSVAAGYHPMVYWIGYYMSTINLDLPPTCDEGVAGNASEFVDDVPEFTLVGHSTEARHKVFKAADDAALGADG